MDGVAAPRSGQLRVSGRHARPSNSGRAWSLAVLTCSSASAGHDAVSHRHRRGDFLSEQSMHRVIACAFLSTDRFLAYAF